MRQTRFALVGSLAVIAAMLFTVSTARADITFYNVNNIAQLSPDGTAMTVSGLVVCSVGEDVDIAVVVLQNVKDKVVACAGDTTLTCDASNQAWAVACQVVLLGNSGSVFKGGSASLISSAGTPTDSEDFLIPLKVKK